MRHNKHQRALWLAAAACFAALFVVAQAPVLFGKVTGFKVPEYFDPPHHKQMKSFLRGAVAEPDANGKIQITDLKLETFREDGTREMIVEAPQCTYDYDAREASSAGPIKATTGDGRLQIEGTGFLLLLTNKSLRISNNVHTIIRDLGNAPLKP